MTRPAFSHLGEACTIVSPGFSPGSVVRPLALELPDRVRVTGPEADWTTLEIQARPRPLVVHRVPWREAGDRAATLRSGFYNYVRVDLGADLARNKRLLDFVNRATVFLGVTGLARRGPRDEQLRVVARLAALASGTVFDGVDFLSPDGTPFLGA